MQTILIENVSIYLKNSRKKSFIKRTTRIITLTLLISTRLFIQAFTFAS